MKKHTFSLLITVYLVLSLLAGCANPGFLTQEDLKKYREPGTEPKIIMAKRTYLVESRKEITERNHLLIVAGQNPDDIQGLLALHTSSFEETKSYFARIIRNGHEEEVSSKADLFQFSAPGSREISGSRFKIPALVSNLNPGDWVEVISEQKSSLPELGILENLGSFPENTENISFCFISPESLDFTIHVLNDTTTFRSRVENGKRIRVAEWKSVKKRKGSPLAASNRNTLILANPALLPETWDEFGSFYRNLIRARTADYPLLKPVADSLTSGITDPVGKMTAIFNFCQSRFRYEQVYLERGEFVPNPVSSILSRKYADCKDYSMMIWALAKNAGLSANLALVMRDRDYWFSKEIPVSQFNHMIVEWTHDGKTRWYDGTNRISVPGLPGDDLINQMALVISDSGTEVKPILESGENALSVTGTLQRTGKDLSGRMTLSLSAEFALTLNYMGLFLNEMDFRKFLQHFLKNLTGPDATLTNLSWSLKKELTTISFTGSFPNTVTSLNGDHFTSLSRILPGLLPFSKEDLKTGTPFSFPGYHRGAISLEITGEPGSVPVPLISLNFSFEPGPVYTEESAVKLADGLTEFYQTVTRGVKIPSGK
ncbi:MAG: transglutaminase-like domain-containing protein [Bacteroidetes bacterium]|nr:transglutaminase-like domain-containing protein [Bacteroidota bacterium]